MRIHIEGPSSPFRPEALARGVALLRRLGHDVVGDVGALRGGHAFLNGDDDVRRRALDAALHSDADVIWLARGGYGLTRIVDDLTIPARIPVVVGFSDSTALFGRLAVAGHLDRCVHGPLATTIANEDDAGVARALAVIARRAGQPTTPPPLPPLRVLRRGASDHVADDLTGPLWAGNLVVLAALCGTPSMPSLANHIVVLEEVGERPYRLDRLLTQVLRSGALRDVAAVVIGHLTGCDEPTTPTAAAPTATAPTATAPTATAPTATAPTTTTRDAVPTGLEVVLERLAALAVPVCAGLPAGHEAPNLALPLGGIARLVVERGGDGDAATLVADG